MHIAFAIMDYSINDPTACIRLSESFNPSLSVFCNVKLRQELEFGT